MKQLSYILLALVFISCGADSASNETDGHSGETAEHSEEVTTEEEETGDPLDGLSLKEDGSKWEVNPETQIGMVQIDSMLQAFDGTDFVVLGTEVKEVLSQIIDQCTMKGEDHNQYHIVLHACMKESKAMKRGEVETTENLERFVSAYYEHFQVWAEAPDGVVEES